MRLDNFGVREEGGQDAAADESPVDSAKLAVEFHAQKPDKLKRVTLDRGKARYLARIFFARFQPWKREFALEPLGVQ